MEQTDLRAIRLGLGRTLDAHALAADVDPSTISRLERGGQMPRPGSLVRIAVAYGLPVDRLYALAILAKSANSSGVASESTANGLSLVGNGTQGVLRRPN